MLLLHLTDVWGNARTQALVEWHADEDRVLPGDQSDYPVHNTYVGIRSMKLNPMKSDLIGLLIIIGIINYNYNWVKPQAN